jgi:hypothetical protein
MKRRDNIGPERSARVQSYIDAKNIAEKERLWLLIDPRDRESIDAIVKKDSA